MRPYFLILKRHRACPFLVLQSGRQNGSRGPTAGEEEVIPRHVLPGRLSEVRVRDWQ